MKVQVLFFGATADAVKSREVEIDFADNIKSAAAFEAIKRSFPQLNQHTLLFAVNQQYASGEETIQNGDELAVFTAVSGG